MGGTSARRLDIISGFLLAALFLDLGDFLCGGLLRTGSCNGRAKSPKSLTPRAVLCSAIDDFWGQHTAAPGSLVPPSPIQDLNIEDSRRSCISVPALLS